jgi:hypothetical protein
MDVLSVQIVARHGNSLYWYLSENKLCVCKGKYCCEISSSHCGEYEVQNCLVFLSLMMKAARTSQTSVDNYFTRQYISEDNSENILNHPHYRWNFNLLYASKKQRVKSMRVFTGCWVVSNEASQAWRPFSGLLCVPICVLILTFHPPVFTGYTRDI